MQIRFKKKKKPQTQDDKHAYESRKNCTAGQFPAAVQATFKQGESCQGQR